MDADDLVGEIDQALAALRRVILRAIGADKALAAAQASIRAMPQPVVKTAGPAVQRSAPAPVAAIKARAPVANKSQAIAATDPEWTNGTVTLDSHDMTITCRGRSVKLAHRQFQLCAVLAKAMPGVVPREECGRRAWPDISAGTRENYATVVVQQANANLAQAGLKISTVRGFGLALAEIGS